MWKWNWCFLVSFGFLGLMIILKNYSFCVQWKKVIHTGLKHLQWENDFSFLRWTIFKNKFSCRTAATSTMKYTNANTTVQKYVVGNFFVFETNLLCSPKLFLWSKIQFKMKTVFYFNIFKNVMYSWNLIFQQSSLSLKTENWRQTTFADVTFWDHCLFIGRIWLQSIKNGSISLFLVCWKTNIYRFFFQELFFVYREKNNVPCKEVINSCI